MAARQLRQEREREASLADQLHLQKTTVSLIIIIRVRCVGGSKMFLITWTLIYTVIVFELHKLIDKIISIIIH